MELFAEACAMGVGAVFIAKYAGRCGDCNSKIEPGDMCHYVDDEVCHEGCFGQHKAALKERARNEKPCPNCFLIHKGECL
jgi:hypothetical protein